jgi:hypothetical protein
MGTIFPFVHTDDNDYNNLFVTTAKLYNLPPAGTVDKINYIRKQTPIQTVRVSYYDCGKGDHIVGAPLEPGVIGATNNPGLPIQWDLVGITTPGTPSPATVTSPTDCPDTPIGKYNFKNIAPDDYVLEISRQGFLIRYGVIKVSAMSDIYLEHREILGGDVNGDAIINEKDLSAIRPKMGIYGTPLYSPTYDFDANKSINNLDVSIIRLILGAQAIIYKETDDWMKTP